MRLGGNMRDEGGEAPLIYVNNVRRVRKSGKGRGNQDR